MECPEKERNHRCTEEHARNRSSKENNYSRLQKHCESSGEGITITIQTTTSRAEIERPCHNEAQYD